MKLTQKLKVKDGWCDYWLLMHNKNLKPFSMPNKSRIATVVLHIYIIVFLVVLCLNISSRVEVIMLYFAPVVTFWMFYTVISSAPLKMNRITAADEIL